MKTLAEIDNTIDALKEVSSNALLKHGFSRSRQRIFDLSKSLDQSWQDYKVIHGKNITKNFVYLSFVDQLQVCDIIQLQGVQD